MARRRLIDTDALYFDTEIVNLLGPKGLHVYIRLWGISEDWGGYEPKYADIALQMGALKFTAEEIEGIIQKLIEHRKIIVYLINGKPYHWLVNLMKRQPLDNPSLPTLPLPEWVSCEVHEYKSKKKYAKYAIIREKLPEDYRTLLVGYRDTTGNGVTKRKETKRNVTEGKETSVVTHPPFVILSQEEEKELVNTYGKSVTKDYIERLNNYGGQFPDKFRKYKSHYATIRSWTLKDGVKKIVNSVLPEKSKEVKQYDPAVSQMVHETVKKIGKK